MRDQILKAAIKYLADMGMKKLQIFNKYIIVFLRVYYEMGAEKVLHEMIWLYNLKKN